MDEKGKDNLEESTSSNHPDRSYSLITNTSYPTSTITNTSEGFSSNYYSSKPTVIDIPVVDMSEKEICRLNESDTETKTENSDLSVTVIGSPLNSDSDSYHEERQTVNKLVNDINKNDPKKENDISKQVDSNNIASSSMIGTDTSDSLISNSNNLKKKSSKPAETVDSSSNPKFVQNNKIDRIENENLKINDKKKSEETKNNNDLSKETKPVSNAPVGNIKKVQHDKDNKPVVDEYRNNDGNNPIKKSNSSDKNNFSENNLDSNLSSDHTKNNNVDYQIGISKFNELKNNIEKRIYDSSSDTNSTSTNTQVAQKNRRLLRKGSRVSQLLSIYNDLVDHPGNRGDDKIKSVSTINETRSFSSSNSTVDLLTKTKSIEKINISSKTNMKTNSKYLKKSL